MVYSQIGATVDLYGLFSKYALTFDRRMNVLVYIVQLMHTH